MPCWSLNSAPDFLVVPHLAHDLLSARPGHARTLHHTGVFAERGGRSSGPHSPLYSRQAELWLKRRTPFVRIVATGREQGWLDLISKVSWYFHVFSKGIPSG